MDVNPCTHMLLFRTCISLNISAIRYFYSFGIFSVNKVNISMELLFFADLRDFVIRVEKYNYALITMCKEIFEEYFKHSFV